MIKLHCCCQLPKSFEGIEDTSFSALIKRVTGTVGEALKQLSYVIFLAGVVGFSVVALADPFAHILSAPFYLIIGGGLSYLFGAFLQGLAGRNIYFKSSSS